MTSKDWVSAEKQDKNSDQIEELEKVPPLRFPEFSGNWNGIKLKRIFTNKTSNLSINNLLENKGEYKLYGATGLIKCIDFYEINVPYVAIVKDGAGVGRITLCDENSSILGTMQALIAKEDFDLKFSYYSLNKINFNKYVIGSTIPHIYFKDYSKETVFVPSINEQKKISAFITLVDKKIELMEKKYKTLQKYKSALIQQIFTKNIRFSNFSNNWNYYSLGELGETYSGLTGLSKENFEHGTSKFIPYKVIFDNEVIDINSLEPVQLNNKKQEPVKKGDLFFTGSSETPEEVGMVSVLNKKIENCYLNSFCFGYRLNDFMKVNPLFLSYLLRSPLIRRKIKVLGQGSTRFNISKKEIMKLTVEIPSLEEQKKIITLLENLTNNIHFMKNKNSKIKEFKKYLLQQMFV